MSAPIFISYRREDSSAEAGRLHNTILRELSANVFMDTPCIEPGAQWSERLEKSLWSAVIVIVVIGPEWLRISDEYGLRRIDAEDDWVRREIEYAIDHSKIVLPLLVGGAKMPPTDKLPEPIRTLAQKQAVEIRDTYWDHDIKLVTERLRVITGTETGSKNELELDENLRPYPVPPPEVPDPISEEKLAVALRGSLSSWQKVVSQLPEKSTDVRVEIFREYKFKTFLDAIGFMNQVAPGCEIALHHPRWENLWRFVRVYLTTWDIGHRISDRDIQLAKYLDQAFSEFPGAVSKK